MQKISANNSLITPVKVLYIGGFSRSGSTLLGRVLGEAPNTVCVGETSHLWSRGLIDNVQCGCGELFYACPFWTAVGEEAFGGWSRMSAERFAKVDHVTNRFRALPAYWAPWLRPGFVETIDEYAYQLARVYAAISRISGVSTIVETSKNPSFGSVLIRIPNSDVRIIHLVRDSRAVAYSWTRIKPMPSPIGDERLMPRFTPAMTATKWLAWNLALHALSTRPSPYLRLNYESFVANPQAALQKLSLFSDETLVLPDSQLTDGKVKLSAHHIFSGNPMRANAGWLNMHLDNEWQTMLPASQRAKVTAMTWPLLRLYSYPV